MRGSYHLLQKQIDYILGRINIYMARIYEFQDKSKIESILIFAIQILIHTSLSR